MSLLQQHFEERREYIFNRLKQPQYVDQSIEKIRQAQKEIKNTVRAIKDLFLLDRTTDPCLPDIAQVSLQHIINSDSFENIKTLVPSSVRKLDDERRANILDETLSTVNKVTNLERTVFVMMFNSKEQLLMDFYKKNVDHRQSFILMLQIKKDLTRSFIKHVLRNCGIIFVW